MTPEGRNEVEIRLADVVLPGYLEVAKGASGVVVFSHGSGSSRDSPRNNYVAHTIRKRGLGTLLLDLLTPAEDRDRNNRFDIPLLTRRLSDAVDWLADRRGTSGLPVGLFGSSTGAASALRTAAARPERVRAVVSRGGRVDLAEDATKDVRAPTLCIVGGADAQVLALNRKVLGQLMCEKYLHVVEGAGHLFEGSGELEEVAEVAAAWFETHLVGG